MPHITRRSAYQTAGSKLFRVLAHVYPDHVVLRIEKILRKAFCQLSLSDSCRTEKEKGSDRPVGILESGTVAADGTDDLVHRIILTDNPFLQSRLHAQKPVPFRLGDTADRNSGHLGNDGRNVIRPNDITMFTRRR